MEQTAGKIINITEKTVDNRKKHDTSMDFLRVLAITLVIASHAKILEQGGVGNCIFFALSGFFVAMPFKKDGELAFLSFKEWIFYYGKRLLRVLPAYYTYLLFVAYFTGTIFVTAFDGYGSLLLHMCFFKVGGHLWFIQQEMAFFLICPVILCLTAILKKTLKKVITKDWQISLLQALFVAILAYLFYRFLHINLYGNNSIVAFMPQRIMTGMVAAYLYQALKASLPKLGETKGFQILTDIYMVFFVLFCILSSEWILSRIDPAFTGYYIGWENPLLVLNLTCLALILLASSGNCLFKKFASHPLIGFLASLSFSMYLFHFPFLSLLGSGSRARTFLLVYLVTVGFAYLVKKGIEEPVQKLFKKRRPKENKVLIA